MKENERRWGAIIKILKEKSIVIRESIVEIMLYSFSFLKLIYGDRQMLYSIDVHREFSKKTKEGEIRKFLVKQIYSRNKEILSM